MKFDFEKAAQAFVPSLKNSWQHAIAGATVGLLSFNLGGVLTGAVVGGLANTGVEMYKVGRGAPGNWLG